MKKTILLFAFFIYFVDTNAQTPDWLWVRNSSVSSSSGDEVTVDALGNVYVAGQYTDSIKFGSITLYSAGGIDCFLTKYTPDGRVIWAKTAGGTDWDETTGIMADDFGHIYVCGTFSSTSVNFWGVSLHDPAGSIPYFLVKLDTAGNAIWGICSPPEPIYDLRMAKDKKGDVIMQGKFGGFKLSIGNYNFYNYNAASTNVQFFIVKYDSSGNLLWADAAHGDCNFQVTSLATDEDGNSYSTGLFYGGGTNINNQFTGAGSETFQNVTIYDPDSSFNTAAFYLVKYNPAGNVVWAKSSYSRFFNSGYNLTVSKNNRLYITGSFADTSFTFESITLKKLDTTSLALPDFFLMQLDTAGNAQWATVAGSKGLNEGYAITTDPNDNIYVVGTMDSLYMLFNNIMYYNPDTTGHPSLFVVKYDSKGMLKWFKPAGSAQGTSICYYSDNDIYVGGDVLYPPATFNNDTLSAHGYFVAKLGNEIATYIGATENEMVPSIYPNPASSNFHLVSGNNQNTRFCIYNMLGEMVYNSFVTLPDTEINISDFIAGVYFIKLQNNKKSGEVKLVVVK